MNSRQTIRLSQFYRLRIRPLAEQYPPIADKRDAFIAAFFEAVGWLTEGVFCGYFDPGEADILWVNLAGLRDYCGSPSHRLVAPSLASEIGRVYRSIEPFRASRQMPDGGQKTFELPLFPNALQLSDRWANDTLASNCWSFLDCTNDNSRKAHVYDPDIPVDPSEAARALEGNVHPDGTLGCLLAGFIHILDHMELSRSFFDYARNRSDRKSDFESYCQRIGGLNAWRVPILNEKAVRKMEDLYNLLEFAMRASISQTSLKSDWSSVEAPIRKQFDSLLKSWEADHLIAFFELA